MSVSKLANTIANALENACGLDVTPSALDAIEGCLQRNGTGKAGAISEQTIELERLDVKVGDIVRKHEVALKQAEERAAKREDLEVWRQAYNAVLSGCEVARMVESSDSPCSRSPSGLADQALADYRAKREEMGIWARTKNSQP